MRNLAWQAIDTLTRAQLILFQELGDRINLTMDDRRRVLNLDNPTWAAWMEFLQDGKLPSEPALPDLLRRLGRAAFNLSLLGDHVQGCLTTHYPRPTSTV